MCLFNSPEAEELLLKDDAKLWRHFLSQAEPSVAEAYIADLTRPGRLTAGVAHAFLTPFPRFEVLSYALEEFLEEICGALHAVPMVAPEIGVPLEVPRGIVRNATGQLMSDLAKGTCI